MIAEVVPQAGDLATKTDIAELKAYIDSRLLRYTMMILVPISLTMLGMVSALMTLVVKL
ncbi:MAG TPA: hypothetical protein VFA34_06120 [Actinomycetota bacterium]|jgi:hypothetical protein|nr:hypothetical protein [Actinomycetota bacterium]